MDSHAVKTIFLAEGENHVRAALRLQIELLAEYQISGEADHTEGLLAQVCQQPPDILLLDWHLPGINPHRLIQTLRKHCPDTILVATSVKPEDQKSAISFGMDEFLSKQHSPADFITRLLEINSRKRKEET